MSRPFRSTAITFVLTAVGLTATALTGCTSAPPPPASPTACNGHDSLCFKRYDEVAYATTHNAHSLFGPFIAPNQDKNIPTQLNDGVRGLMLDTYDSGAGTEVKLCHGSCAGGSTSLVAALNDLRSFLEAHPRDVVTIILENYATTANLNSAFNQAGLAGYLYTGTQAPWPTLKSMVDSGKRLVVMTDTGGGAYPWLIPVFNVAFETDWEASSVDALNHCRRRRGTVGAELFILNHFVTAIGGSMPAADQANKNPFLIDRANTCAAAFNELPNFVTVDYYQHGGGLFQAVNTLNGV